MRHLGMNAPPFLSSEDWEAARQRVIAKERAQMRSGGAVPRRLPGVTRDEDGQPVVPLRATPVAPPPRKEDPQPRSRVPRRFMVAVFGGAAAILVWWSYGNAAKRMIASLAPPRIVTTQDVPDAGTSPDDRTDGEVIAQMPGTTEQSAPRTTRIDQIPPAEADAVPAEKPADTETPPAAASDKQPRDTKARPAVPEKSNQVVAANQYDSTCFPSASAVLRNHPGGHASWTMRAPGHEGTQCWYAALGEHRRR